MDVSDSRQPEDQPRPDRSERTPGAAGPGPTSPSGLPARRKSTAPPSRTGVRLLLIVAALASGGLLTAVKLGLFSEPRAYVAPLHVAEDFVSNMKLGEEAGDDGDPRCGLKRAHDMFCEELAASLPWMTFFEDWVRLVRQHGPIMSSHRVSESRSSRRRQRGRRRRRVRYGSFTYVYRLRLGNGSQSLEQMASFLLTFTMKRDDDGLSIQRYSLSQARN